MMHPGQYYGTNVLSWRADTFLIIYSTKYIACMNNWTAKQKLILKKLSG